MFTVIFIYLFLMIGIGIWQRKKAKGKDDFFVAGRRGNLAFISGSLLATIMGGSSVIGLAGLGFRQGLVGSWWLLSGACGLLILGCFLVGKVRATCVYTLPEILKKQYNAAVALAASILIVVAWTGVVAGQIVAAGKVLSITGTGSTTFWMVIFTVVFVIYTILGGQFSIIHTDFLQALIFISGTMLVLIMLLPDFSLVRSLPPDYFYFPVNDKFNILDLFLLLILVGGTYIVGPDIYTRILCAKDKEVARKSVFITAMIITILAFAITFTGMSARALYPEISPEQAFPQIIKEALPPGLNAIVLAALLAALMSSADTCLLSQSIILTEDILKNLYPLNEKKTILFTRINLIILGLIALVLALTLKGVISSLLFAYTIFTCGLVIPTIAGFYKEKLKLSSRGALSALIGGGTAGLLGKIPHLNIPFKEHLPLMGIVICTILLFGVSFITREKY